MKRKDAFRVLKQLSAQYPNSAFVVLRWATVYDKPNWTIEPVSKANKLIEGYGPLEVRMDTERRF